MIDIHYWTDKTNIDFLFKWICQFEKQLFQRMNHEVTVDMGSPADMQWKWMVLNVIHSLYDSFSESVSTTQQILFYFFRQRNLLRSEKWFHAERIDKICVRSTFD